MGINLHLRYFEIQSQYILCKLKKTQQPAVTVQSMQNKNKHDSNVKKHPSPNDTVISLRNVSMYYKLYNSPKDRLKEALSPTRKKYHKEFYATNDINLEIKKGEIVGIVGKNGSGKSTLLKLITGILTPSTGNIIVNGDISALLELGSGFNPQFTGIENIYFYGTVLGFSKKQMDEKLDEIIAFADIGEFISQPIKTYSSGMKSRLGFAVAIHIEPEILILDEVLSVGDVLFKRKSYAKMQEFFESGKTIIYVSHNTNEVNRLCTRAVLLLDGEIIMDGDPKTITKYYEKYLFSKKANQAKIKQEILNYTFRTEQETSKIDLSSAEIKSPQKENPFQVSIEPEVQVNNPLQQLQSKQPLKEISEKKEDIKNKDQQAFLIPDFESQNQVEYDNTLLDIYDICIKTMEGEKVNALLMHERYKYCYKLKFKDEFFNIGFGMQIHTEKGIVISGCGSRQCIPEQVIDHVKAGDILQLEWEFDCLMHQGLYYTNTGVNHFHEGKREFINRITDAFVFKVLPLNSCCGGLVSLHQTPPIITFLE